VGSDEVRDVGGHDVVRLSGGGDRYNKEEPAAAATAAAAAAARGGGEAPGQEGKEDESARALDREVRVERSPLVFVD